MDIDAVYRLLDKLKHKVEQIAFNHTKRVLHENISIVFYDMATLYFEASDEDDLCKTGFSKDGKYQCPQIFIGLLVDLGGYAIGYDIFEGNIDEGHTLIPFLKKISLKFGLNMPMINADAGLLSKENIRALQEHGCKYILGARIKNETEAIKQKIRESHFREGTIKSYTKNNISRLLVAYTDNRAQKDAYNRKYGLKQIKKQINTWLNKVKY
ncbi:MAG: IS1634 family transposase [Bacteroidales bacterium]